MKLPSARRKVFAIFSVIAIAVSVYSVLTIAARTLFNTNAVYNGEETGALLLSAGREDPEKADAVVSDLDSSTESELANANMTISFLDSSNNAIDYASLGLASSANTTLKLKVSNNTNKVMHISGITIENKDASSVSSLSLTGWEGGITLNKNGTTGDSNVMTLSLTVADGKYTTNIDETKKIKVEYYFEDTFDGNSDTAYRFTQTKYIEVVGRVADSLSKLWFNKKYPNTGFLDLTKHTRIVFKITEQNVNNIGTNDFYIAPSTGSLDESTKTENDYYVGDYNYTTDIYVNTSKYSDFSALPIRWKFTYPYVPGATDTTDEDGDKAEATNDTTIISYDSSEKWFMTVNGNITLKVGDTEATGNYYNATTDGITVATDLYDSHNGNLDHGIGIPNQGGGSALMALSGTIPSSAGTTEGYIPITISMPVIATADGGTMLRSTGTVNMTIRVHTYTNDDIKNATDIINQLTPVTDYIDESLVTEYENAVIEAEKVVSNHQRSAETLKDFVDNGSARLVAAQNGLVNNLYSAKNVLMQKDVKKSGDLNSANADTKIRYRVYAQNGDGEYSYSLPYWNDYKNAKDKYNDIAADTVEGNKTVEYDYWDISLDGYNNELTLDNEAIANDHYTDESRQALQDKVNEIVGLIDDLSYNEPTTQQYVDDLVSELVAARNALVPKCKIVFENYDGTELYTVYVVPGSVPTYIGDTPTKTATVDKVFTFNNWSPKDSGPAYGEAVNTNVTYVAQFNDGTPRPYNITFYNQNKVDGDWEKLCDQTVYYGAEWNPCASTASRESTVQYDFRFAGWDITGNNTVISPLVAIDGAVNVEYRAIYENVTRSYEVKFYDGDGENVLQQDNVLYGTTPVYNGVTPTKAKTAQYTYTWDGTWTPEISPVKGEISYYPNFTSTVNKYKVEFRNYNDELLEVFEGEEAIPYGTVPVYTGDTPVKPETAEYFYQFDGWETDVVAVTGDAVYKAKFKEILREYTVTFKNGTQVVHTEVVKYGDTPVWNEEVEQDSDAKFEYTFQDWSPSVDQPITGETTYIAKYARTKRIYMVDFVNYDNSYLYATITHYGDAAIYPFDTLGTPTREGGLGYTYEFAGWDSIVSTMNGQIRYVAKFNQVFTNYTVIFKDDNGAELLKKEDYRYGDTIVAPADPTKAADNTYTYTFTGWNPTFVAGTTVTEDVTYTAVYDSEYIEYTVTFDEDNGSEPKVTSYHYGDTIVAPADPTKAADNTYTYTFTGWNPTFVAGTTVTEDVTYTANYDGAYINYTIIFKDEEGNELSKKEDYHYGDTVVVPDAPKKEATPSLKYIFNGWGSEVTEVNGDKIYQAVYLATPYEITYEWLKNQTYNIGTDNESVLRIDVALRYFEHVVEVDDVVVEEGVDYVVTEGSTVITLQKDFLDGLELGEHTLTVYYDEDVVVSTTFEVEEEIDVPDTGFLSGVTNFVVSNIYQSSVIVFATTMIVFGVRRKKEQ